MKRWLGFHQSQALGLTQRRGVGVPTQTKPDVPERASSSGSLVHADAATRWMSVESFRTLRTNLLTCLPDGSKLLLVTSSRPQEGKSTVVVNLACSISSLGKSVLLVDADLRRPRIHEFFNSDNRSGLTDVLSGEKALDDVLERVPQGPHLLTSGSIPDDPQQLLTSERFPALLVELKTRFDLVLIDSAPFLAVADTSLILPRVDGVVFVVRYGLVTESEAIRTKIRLDAAGAPVVGAVFNAFESSDPDYYHPYAGYYTRPDEG